MAASDRARAQAVTQLRTAQTYTDGATIPGRATGWGYCTTGTNGEGEQEESRSWGRIEGEQSNDLGEAMALLQALRNTHPLTPVDVYIDNGGVVATTNKRHHRDVRARMRQGGRAIWNRIEQLMQLRRSNGTHTGVHWIHSHVDEEGRRAWKDTCKLECACGGMRRRECDPTHPHHRGNEQADECAKKGMLAAPEGEHKPQLRETAGEEEYHLKHMSGDVCQVDVTAFMKEHETRRRLAAMLEEGSAATKAHPEGQPRKLRWAQAEAWGDKPLRAAMAKAGTVTARFKVRARAGALPAYSDIAKKCTGAGPYQDIYGESISEVCPSCEETVAETQTHIFCDCKALDAMRSTMVRAVKAMWVQGRAEAEWAQYKWVSTEGGETIC